MTNNPCAKANLARLGRPLEEGASGTYIKASFQFRKHQRPSVLFSLYPPSLPRVLYSQNVSEKLPHHLARVQPVDCKH